MKIKVFYSWQSDMPNPTNRTFVENALKKAVKELNKKATQELEIEDADRSEMVLDSDTKNEPGSPHIASTIFRKIDEADIFVADLTYVAQRPEGKGSIPNPNVLIEYGYALANKTNARVFGVMNTEYGGPDQLPFDLRHYKYPVCYKLSETTENKAEVLSDLTKQLEIRLRDTAKAIPAKVLAPSHQYAPKEPLNSNKSFFLPDGKAIEETKDWEGNPHSIRLVHGSDIYLRLYPEEHSSPITNEQIRALLPTSPELTRPMGRDNAPYRNSNEWGYVHLIGLYKDHDTAKGAFQLFKAGEIWTYSSEYLLTHQGKRYISESFEKELAGRMEVYRSILEKLGIKGPYRWEVGMVGIKGAHMILPQLRHSRWGGDAMFTGTTGNCLVPEIRKAGRLEQGQDTSTALESFFASVWDEFQVPRDKIREAVEQDEKQSQTG